jgi:hypothetical protein
VIVANDVPPDGVRSVVFALLMMNEMLEPTAPGPVEVVQNVKLTLTTLDELPSVLASVIENPVSAYELEVVVAPLVTEDDLV